MPILSSRLPQYKGPYAVGAIDLEIPCPRRSINNLVCKTTSEPAFEFSTVLFTLYYPAQAGSKSSKPCHYWISRPLALTSTGYARLARVSNSLTNCIFKGALWALAGNTTIPADIDVPISRLVEKSANGKAGYKGKNAQYPVIVFSHGVAGSRTSNSQYCGELASRGYVVAAIEHRDGSGPASVINNADGTTRVRNYLTLDDIKHDGTFDTPELKEAQLSFRQAEVEETIAVLRRLNDGQGAQIFKDNLRSEGQTLHDWGGMLDVDAITISGHSYGATLALRLLREIPTKQLPISGAVVLDPGKQSGPLNDKVHVPIMVVNSNSWSSKHSIFFGRPHFEVVKDLVQKARDGGLPAWFFTSMGTSHPSITDAPLIEPTLLSWTTGTTLDVYEALTEYVGATHEFISAQRSGTAHGLLTQPVSHESYDKPVESSEGKAVLDAKFAKNWQIHVAPI